MNRVQQNYHQPVHVSKVPQNVSFQHTQHIVPMVGSTASKLLKEPNILFKTLHNVLAKPLKYFEHEGMEIGALPLFVIVVFYMMGTRYKRARNDDERREVLTRDAASGFTALFLTYAIKRFFAKVMEKKIGVPGVVKTTEGKTKFTDWFSRKSGDMYIKSYEEIGETYSAKNAEQLRKYADYIPLNIGRKLLNNLPEESKKALQTLEKLNFFDNKTNLTLLLQQHPHAKEKIAVVLDAINQHIVPRAKMAKVIPDTIATLFAIGLLGIGIPWFNIAYTKYLYESGKKRKS